MRKKLIVVLLFLTSGMAVLDVVAKKATQAPPAKVAPVTLAQVASTPAPSVTTTTASSSTATTHANATTKSSHAHGATNKHAPKTLAQHAKKHQQPVSVQETAEDKPADADVALNTTTNSPAQNELNQEVLKLCASSSQHPDPNVLKLALTAYDCAVATGTARPRTLTVIDYSVPSTQKRMWVFDLTRNRLLFNTYAAHGQGSGGVVPDYFSNRAQTHASSLGLFVTEQEYIGHEGYSLRLRGLEGGFNDQAESRGIVVHGAPYVSASIAKSGRLGRSWGCPAVPQEMAVPIINSIKGGNLVFSYYPDSKWLRQSKFLHCPVPNNFMAAAHSNSSISAM